MNPGRRSNVYATMASASSGNGGSNADLYRAKQSRDFLMLSLITCGICGTVAFIRATSDSSTSAHGFGATYVAWNCTIVL
jgi:hypothetical protein